MSNSNTFNDCNESDDFIEYRDKVWEDLQKNLIKAWGGSSDTNNIVRHICKFIKTDMDAGEKINTKDDFKAFVMIGTACYGMTLDHFYAVCEAIEKYRLTELIQQLKYEEN